jgi:hypothetical protein
VLEDPTSRIVLYWPSEKRKGVVVADSSMAHDINCGLPCLCLIG